MNFLLIFFLVPMSLPSKYSHTHSVWALVFFFCLSLLTRISSEFAYAYWIMWREFKFSAYLFVCFFFVRSFGCYRIRNGKNTRHDTQEVQSTECTGIAFIPKIFFSFHFVLNPEYFNFSFFFSSCTFSFLFYFCRKQSCKQKSFVL